MIDLATFVPGTAGVLQSARSAGGAGVLAEFDNGAFVQYQVNPELRGADGGPLLAVEIGTTSRLNRRQTARLKETGWEAPQGRAMPNWWHLVGDEAEARIVVGQLVVLLMDVFGVSAHELSDGFSA